MSEQRTKSGLHLLGISGSDENPTYLYRYETDKDFAALSKKYFKEKEENDLAERQERFLTLRWENQFEEEEFFDLATKLIEDDEFYEMYKLENPEFVNRLIELGTLEEYREVIELYKVENRPDLENEKAKEKE